MASTTAIITCSCAHKAQDGIYGQGKRLANQTTKADAKGGPPIYRCTVCGAEKTA